MNTSATDNPQFYCWKCNEYHLEGTGCVYSKPWDPPAGGIREMNEQTEKLKEKIWFVEQEVRLGNLTENEATDQILRVCKDAGLKFTEIGVKGDRIEGALICRVEEVEI